MPEAADPRTAPTTPMLPERRIAVVLLTAASNTSQALRNEAPAHNPTAAFVASRACRIGVQTDTLASICRLDGRTIERVDFKPRNDEAASSTPTRSKLGKREGAASRAPPRRHEKAMSWVRATSRRRWLGTVVAGTVSQVLGDHAMGLAKVLGAVAGIGVLVLGVGVGLRAMSSGSASEQAVSASKLMKELRGVPPSAAYAKERPVDLVEGIEVQEDKIVISTGETGVPPLTQPLDRQTAVQICRFVYARGGGKHVIVADDVTQTALAACP
jgi:hypothetical protein